MARATKRVMVTNVDNMGNGYGKEGGGRSTAAMMGMAPRIGAALENFPVHTYAKKRKFHVGKKKRTHGEGKKNKLHHSQNHQFLLSMMVANIHLGSLFCNIHMVSSQL